MDLRDKTMEAVNGIRVSQNRVLNLLLCCNTGAVDSLV
jgi:hypothetical protein